MGKILRFSALMVVSMLFIWAGSSVSAQEVAPYCETFEAADGDPYTRATNPWSRNNGLGFGEAFDLWNGTTTTRSAITDHTNGGATTVSRFLWVDDSDLTGTEFVEITTPDIDITALTSPELTFYLYQDVENQTGAVSNLLTVSLSTDGGATFTTLGTFQDDVDAWQLKSFDLTPFVGAATTIQIRFRVDATAPSFLNDVSLDDIGVNELGTTNCPPPPPPPSVVTAPFCDGIDDDPIARSGGLNWTKRQVGAFATSDFWDFWVLAEFANANLEAAGDHSGVCGSSFLWVDDSDFDNPLTDSAILTTTLYDVSGLTTPTLSFYLFSDNTDLTDPSNEIGVQIQTGNTFQTLGLINQDAPGWVLHTFDLNALGVTADTFAVVFQFISNTGFNFNNDIGLDDVAITDGGLPVCPAAVPPPNPIVVDTTALPFCEAFDTDPFDCTVRGDGIWFESINDIDSNDWEYPPVDFNPGGGVAAFVDHTDGIGEEYLWVDGSGGNDLAVLTSPFFDLSALPNPALSFYVGSNDITSPADFATISVDFFDGTTWNNGVGAYQGNDPNWVQVTIQLSAFPVSGPARIRINVDHVASGTAFHNDILIDDICWDIGQACPAIDAPVAPAQLLCGDNSGFTTATIIAARGANTANGPLYWFDSPFSGSGNLLFVGDTATFDSLTASTTVYVQEGNLADGICEGPRTAVPITIIPPQPGPTVELKNGQPLGGPSTVTIDIDITTDPFPGETTWELRDGGGTLLASGGPFATANSAQTTVSVTVPGGAALTFDIFDSFGDGIFAPGGYEISSGGTVIVSTLGSGFPGGGATENFTAPGGSALTNNLCPNTAAILCAVGQGGPYVWYDVENGGTPIFTGDTFTSSILTLTGTGAAQQYNFYVEEAVTVSGLLDQFEGGQTNALLWASINDGVTGLADCPAGTGDNLKFGNGSTLRGATTIPLDLTAGGTIDFDIHVGNGGLCETADAGEDVLLQYSIDGGSTWVTIFTFTAGGFTVTGPWDGSAFFSSNAIPAAAQTASTQIRLTQPSNSGGTTDEWAIDNFVVNSTSAAISITCPSARTCFTVNVIDTVAPTFTFCQDDTIVIIPNSGSGCATAVTWTEPVADDNCNFTLTNSHNPGDIFFPPSTVVQYVATDDANNSDTCQFVVVLNPPALAISGVVTDPTGSGPPPTCSGSNGAIDATVTGGCEPYLYLWSNGGTTEDLSGLTIGDYGLTVLDANGSIADATFMLRQPGQLDDNAVVTDPSCTGFADGSIDLTTSGGTPPYTYAWSNGATTEDNTGLIAGPYSVTITDAAGCQFSVSYDLENPLPLLASTDVVDVLCFGDATGEATITANGGTPPYAYAWSNGATTATVTGLTAGSYTATVTDANGCTFPAFVTINENPEIIITGSGGQSSVLCDGDANGSIQIVVSGGVQGGGGPISDNFNGGINAVLWASIVNGTPATTCGAVAGDALFMDFTGTTGFPTPRTATTNALDLTGGGTIDFSLLIGTGGFGACENADFNEDVVLEYSVDGGATFTIINTYLESDPTYAGVFGAVSEAIPAAAQTAGTIIQLRQLGNSGQGFDNWAIDNFVANSPFASGGLLNYSYAWSVTGDTTVFSNSPNIGGLTAGSYTVTVTDGVGCTVSQDFVISTPPPLVLTIDGLNIGPINCSTNTKTQISCNGGSDGGINATVSGGTPFTGVGQTITVSVLTDVFFGETSFDLLDCSGNVLFSAPQGTFNAANQTFTFNIPVSTNSGTGTCFQLDFNDSFGDGIFAPGGFTVEAGGVTYIDQSNGAFTGSLFSQQFTLPAGGTALPPYTFAWSNGATTEDVVGLTAGTYSLTVTDANGCTAVATETLTEPDPIEITVDETLPSCVGFNDGAFTVTGSGCFSPFTIVVEDLSSAPTTQLDIDITTDAFPGETTWELRDGGGTLVASGGPFTTANAAQATVSVNLVGGNYTFDIFDSFGDGIFVPGGYQLTLGGSVIASDFTNSWTTAASESFAVTGAGGTIIGTFTGSGSISGLAAGDYGITVTDGLGCTNSTVFTLNDPPALVFTATGATELLCNGDTDAEIFFCVGGGNPIPASANFTDFINAPNPDDIDVNTFAFSGISPGVTSGTITVAARGDLDFAGIGEAWAIADDAGSAYGDVGGGGTQCGTIFTVSFPLTAAAITQINSTGAITFTATDGGGISTGICTNDSLSITLDLQGTAPGFNGQIITNNPDANNTNVASFATGALSAAGTLTVRARGDLGIAGLEEWDITLEGGPILGSVGGTGPDCEAAEIVINLSASDVAAASGDGILEFTATDGGGAIDNFCGNDSIIWTLDLGVPGGYNIVWSTGDAENQVICDTLTGLGAGSYTVTVTDNNGCTASTTIVVTEPAPVTITLDTLDDVTCFGFNDGRIDIEVSGGTLISSVSDNFDGGFNAAVFASVSGGQSDVDCGSVSGDALHFDAAFGISREAVTVPLNTSNGGTVDFRLTIGDGGTCETADFGEDVVLEYSTDNGATFTIINTYLTSDPLYGGGTFGAVSEAIPAAAQTSATIFRIRQLSNSGANFDEWAIDDFSATIGGGDYSYAWSTGDSTQDISGLGGGTYSVTVTDNNGCTAIDTFTVLEPDTLVGSFTQLTYNCGFNVSCPGAQDGEITINVMGGTPPYMYNWNTGGTAQTITNTGTGTFCVTVIDANGCTFTACVDQTGPTLLVTNGFINSNYNGFDVSCFGAADATIDQFTGGGCPPYTYLWSDGATSEDRSGLAAGVYTVTATDANGCTAIDSHIVTQPDTLKYTVTTFDVLCNGGNTGAATLTGLMGGVPPYTIQWSAGPSCQNLTTCSGLTAGNYIVRVTDANGCRTLANFTINEPTAISLATSVTDADCNGAATGSITVTATGGTPPYTYQWNDSSSQTTATASGLNAGVYCVTVTDANGCVEVTCDTVNEPALLLLSATTVDVSCNGGADGSIDLTVMGGTPPYTYAWQDGPTTEDRAGLSVGTYTVIVTDANGCMASLDVDIDEPPALVLSLDADSALCNGDANGSIDANISGGTMPYTFAWSNGATTMDISGLAAGNYCITVTDANGCTITACADVGEPALLVATCSATDASCNGDSDGTASVATSGGNGGETYAWSNGGTTATITGLAAGTYSVTVTDINGCTATCSATVNEPAALVATCSATDALCFGDANGTATVSVAGGNGGETYLWSNGQTAATATGLAAGTYSVTVTDAKGCTATCSATVGEPMLMIAIAIPTNPLCFGSCDGSIDGMAFGGTPPYSWAWSSFPSGTPAGNTEDLSGLCAGIYVATVTDANGCIATASTVLTDPPLLEVMITNTVDVTCHGGNDGEADCGFVTGGTAPYTFLWSNGATTPTIDMLTAGIYVITVTDANGCTATDTAVINEPPAYVIDKVVTNVSCFGFSDGAIDLTVSGNTPPYTYSWSNGATTEDISGLTAGTYCVTIVDVNGCDTSCCVTVTEPAPLAATSVVTDVSCNGGSDGAIDLTVTGGTTPYSYAWSNGATSEDLSGIMAGTYTVTITDANGCTLTHTATVNEPPALAASTVVTDVTCNGGNDGAIDLTVTGGTPGYSYAWSNGATTEDLSGLTAGTYTVTITDANGCTLVESATVSEPAPWNVTAVITDALCFNQKSGAIDLTVSGNTPPYTYAWSNGKTTEDIGPIKAGTYTVTITDVNGCIYIDSFVVNQPPKIVITRTRTHVTCNGGSDGAIDVTVTGGVPPYTYLWNTGATTEDLSGLTAGTYTVTVTDANGCTKTKNSTINEPDPYMTNEVITEPTCFGFTNGSIDLSVTGNSSPYTYQWSTGATTEDISNLGAGTYTVTITDKKGCVGVFSFTLNEPPLIITITAITNVACNGDATGAIDMTTTGGTPPYTWAWSNGATTEDLSGLTAGTYIVTITDANGCLNIQGFIVSEPPAIVASAAVVDETCAGAADGSIDVTVSGGVPPYTFTWSNGAGTEDLTGLSAGTYTVTITDGNGCTETLTVTVNANNVPPSLSVSTTDMACAAGQGGGSTCSVVDYNGTRSFWLPNLKHNITGVTSNYWTLTNGVLVQNGDGTARLTGIITSNTNSNAGFNVDFNFDNGSNWSQWSAQGKTWKGRSSIVGNLYTTWTYYDYSTSVASTMTGFGDAAGVNLTITQKPADKSMGLQVGDAANDKDSDFGLSTWFYHAGTYSGSGDINSDASCTGNTNCDGAVDLTVSSGTAPFTYMWSNGSTSEDLTNVCGGTYDVTVTDAQGCTSTTSATVNEPTPITITGTVTDESCASCGIAYGGGDDDDDDGHGHGGGHWGGDDDDDDGDDDDDDGGHGGGSPIPCADGGIDISVSGGTPCPVTTTTTTGSFYSKSNLNVGKKKKLDTWCSGTIDITGKSNIDISIDYNSNDGGGNGLESSGGNHDWIDIYYILDGGTKTLFPFNGHHDGETNGTITASVTGLNGSTLKIIVEAWVTYYDESYDITSVDATGTMTMTTEPYTYSWSNGDSDEDLSNIEAGDYTVTVTDCNGCTAEATFTVNKPTELTASAVVTQIDCSQCGTVYNPCNVDLDASPYQHGYHVTSLGNGITVTADNSKSGHPDKAIIFDTDQSGTADPDLEVNVGNILIIAENDVDANNDGLIDSPDDEAKGGKITLDWGTEREVVSLVAVDIEKKAYIDLYNANGTKIRTVTVYPNGNMGVSTVNINEKGVAKMRIRSYQSGGWTDFKFNCPSTTACNTGEIDLTVSGGTAPYTYAWSDGSTSEDLTGLTEGDYTVTVTDANGCTPLVKTYTIDDCNSNPPVGNPSGGNYCQNYGGGYWSSSNKGRGRGRSNKLDEVDAVTPVVADFTAFNLNAYPNPFATDVTIEYTAPELGSKVTIVVINNIGQVVFHDQYQSEVEGTATRDINFDNLASGVYYVTIKTDDIKETVKLIKQD